MLLFVTKDVIQDRVRIGIRTGAAVFDRVLQPPLDFPMNLGEVLFREKSGGQGALAKAFKGAPSLPGFDLFLGAVVGPRIAFVMTNGSIGLAFHERGTAVRTRPGNRRTRRVVNGHDVIPVDLDSGYGIRRGATGHAGVLGRPVEGCLRRIQVVFADVDDGEIPDPRHIQTLMKRSAIDRSIAEESDDDLAAVAKLRAESSPRSQRN